MANLSQIKWSDVAVEDDNGEEERVVESHISSDNLNSQTSSQATVSATTSGPSSTHPNSVSFGRLPLLPRSSQNQVTKDPSNSSKPAAIPVPSSFEFINATGPDQYSDAFPRSRARAHVMRQVHQEKDRERAARQRATRSRDAVTIENRSRVESPHEEMGHEEIMRNLSRGSVDLCFQGEDVERIGMGSSSEMVLSGASDALLATMGSMSQNLGVRRDHILRSLGGMEQRLVTPRTVSPGRYHVNMDVLEGIRHCTRVFALNSIPMSQEFEAEWFKKALNDRACCHGAMFLATAHRIRVFGLQRSIPPEFFAHKGEAIRIINECLGDPEARVEDGTVAAILCLAAFENMMGSETAASVHIEGIKRVVTLKGGLENLGMGGFLSTIILWVDLGNSLVASRPPNFSPDLLPAHLFPRPDSQSLPWHLWQESLLPQLSLPPPHLHFRPPLPSLLYRLMQLSFLVLEARTRPASPSLCRAIFASHALILESQFSASLWGRDWTAERDPVVRATADAFHAAGFIYLYFALREIPLEVTLYNKLVTRIKSTFETLDRDNIDVLHGGLEADFLLWVLMVGGAAALRREERTWFVRKLKTLGEMMVVRSWEDWKGVCVLSGWPWVDNGFAKGVRGFWEEVEMDEIVWGNMDI